MGHPILVLAVYASVVQEMLVVFLEKPVFLVLVCVVASQLVPARHLGPIVMLPITFVNARLL